MALITQESIDEVITSNPVESVIAEYVSLKRSGANLKGLCPFHEEKTPSFMVHPEKGIFHCFGCNVGGNVIGFVQKQEGLEFIDAVKFLAQRSGVTLKYTGGQPQESKGPDPTSIFDLAAKGFHNWLVDESIGSKSINYLKNRGLDRSTISKFNLGFAPGVGTKLTDWFARCKVDLSSASKLGLIIKRDNGPGYFDRFRNRVIYPIHNHWGRLVGFGGRLLDGDGAKYINTPESAYFKKGKILYGLFLAKDSIKKNGLAVVTEGYMDVIALHQADITNSVAVMGVALTVDHLRLLTAHTREIVFVFDRDTAGTQASLRSVDICLEHGITPRILSLPEGEDPDSFIRTNGADKFRELVDNAESFLEFRLTELKLKFSQDNIDQKVRIIEELRPTLSKVTDMVKRQFYIKEIAEKLNLDYEVVRMNLRFAATEKSDTPILENYIKKIQEKQQTREKLGLKTGSVLDTAKCSAIRFLANEYEVSRDGVDREPWEKLLKVLNEYYEDDEPSGSVDRLLENLLFIRDQNGVLEVNKLLGFVVDNNMRELFALILAEEPFPKAWEKAIMEVVKVFRIEILDSKLKRINQSPNFDQDRSLIDQYTKLQKEKAVLANLEPACQGR